MGKGDGKTDSINTSPRVFEGIEQIVLAITLIDLASILLALNEMVLVIVIEAFFAIEHEHRYTTEHEHEITNKSHECGETGVGLLERLSPRFSTNVGLGNRG